ncbi:MAG: sensor domain-containing diguanylate cyclase, partial [Deltaproteobacteria bacterium]|nr:sensor domain-containing diguanylate cyclase [Deltaproteobacteria bacterium]
MKTHLKGNDKTERVHQLVTFSEIGKALTSSLDLKKVLSVVLEKISEHLHPKDWVLFLKNGQSDQLVCEIAAGEHSGPLRGKHIKSGEGVAGWVMEQSELVVLNNPANDARIKCLEEEMGLFGKGAVIAMPLKNRGMALGAVVLYNVEGDIFAGTENLLLLTTVADYTAIAIDNAVLFNKVEELTIIDDLTLLYNTRYLHLMLDYEIEKARRYGHELSMVFMDIDFFKQVNDSHGHFFGSKLLQEMGDLIKASIRSIDVPFRYGGDEFVVLMPETAKESARRVAERIRLFIKNTVFLKEDHINCRITASFGVSTFPLDADNKLDLLKMT